MCWSGEASTALAAVGFGTTAYAAWRGTPAALWAPLGYFSLMEALQAYTYTVIDNCSNPANQIATILGYIHISFQPFFGVALALYFVPENVQRKMRVPAYCFCLFSAVYMLIQLYPFQWAGPCNLTRSLCYEELCSFSGNWHIAWGIPLNGIGNFMESYAGSSFFPYIISMFIFPILFGSWRLSLYHLIMGPLLAMMLTDNKNEWPAIWCLLSIGILIVVVKTPFRKLLYVNNWILWPNSWKMDLSGRTNDENDKYGTLQ